MADKAVSSSVRHSSEPSDGRPQVWSVRVSAMLIGSAFSLIIAGNRWASYIKSPIPGLYLTDLLLLLGVIASVPLWRDLRNLKRWVWWTYGAVMAYLVVVLAPELLVVPSEDRLMAVRDAAPFLYFSLVPVVAVTLRRINARTAIYVARGATVLVALGTLLVHIGALRPVSSPIFGSDFVAMFSYRSDLSGAALAIGMVAWGGWSVQSVRAVPLAQLSYVAIAAVAGVSRSGLVAVVIAICVVAYRQRHALLGLLTAGVSVLILVLGILYGSALAGAYYSPVPVSTPSNPQPEASPAHVEVAPEASPAHVEVAPEASPAHAEVARAETDAWAERITRAGTISARLHTWNDVVTGLAGNGTWLLGGAAGSDYLYELCTGIPVAPESVWAEPGDPKCAVDDYGPEPVVRDPHNWVLNIAITHGVLGVAVFVLVIGMTLWRGRRSEIYLLAGWTIGFFLATGTTFLISAGYALLPMAVGAAWIVGRAGFRCEMDVAEGETSTTDGSATELVS